MNELFDAVEPRAPPREVMADGAMLLRGRAFPFETDVLSALQAIADQAPFRHMTTPGGYAMSVAMTNCGAAGWITDRTGSKGQHREGFETMIPLGGGDAKTRCAKTGRTVAAPDSTAGRFYRDPAKALVMTRIGQLVHDGYAERAMLDNGDVELRLLSGEVLLLADATMTRVK